MPSPVRLLTLLAGLLALPPGLAAAAPLSLAQPPGALETAQRETLLAPFTEATGIPTSHHAWDGLEASLPGLLGGAHPADLVLLRGDMLRRACAAHELEKLDWAALGGRQKFLTPAVSDCGLGTLAITTVLAWDRDKFQGTPGWADFWDIARIPGKRGLRRGARTTLEIALLADGVAASDIYKTLRTKDGVDRAFRKLDQLRPYITWWTTGSEAVRILAAGQVLLTSAPNGETAQAALRQKRNLGLQWEQSLAGVLSWAVRRDSAEQAQAHRFLKFAADPAVQARLTARIPYGGLARGAADHLPPDIAALSSTTHLGQSLAIDEDFWRDNEARLDQRLEEWLKS